MIHRDSGRGIGVTVPAQSSPHVRVKGPESPGAATKTNQERQMSSGRFLVSREAGDDTELVAAMWVVSWVLLMHGRGGRDVVGKGALQDASYIT